MPGTSPVILLFGAGTNIGQAVARTLASRGYKVALAARSLNEADSTDNQLNTTSNFANSNDIVNAFKNINNVFGIPSVVIYNDPLALPWAAFNHDRAINVTSAFIAAQQAVSSFAQLPASVSRTFIYTGNILNITILPSFLDQGVGKSASAYMIWAASAAYKDRGIKLYLGDERKADETAIYRVDGEAHAKLYWKLAEEKTHGPWMHKFVKGVGYTKFDSQCASSS